MAQVISYNPKTGAKLKSGESVTFNGRTYTQGSSNINGTSGNKTTSNAGSESVMALQRYLNMKGANLKVDGISGPLTKAAQAKYGSSSTVNQSYANTNMSRPGSISTSFKTTPVSSKSSSGFSSILNKLVSPFSSDRSLQTGNALQGNFLDTITLPDGSKQTRTLGSLVKGEQPNNFLTDYVPGYAQVTNKSYSPYTVDPQAWNPNPVKKEISNSPNSQTMDLSLGLPETSINPDQKQVNTDSGITSVSSSNTTPEPTPTITNTATTTPDIQQADTSNINTTTGITTNNANSLNNFNNALGVFTNDMNTYNANPFDKNQMRQNGAEIAIKDRFISSISNSYNDPNAFLRDVQTNPNMQAELQKIGIKPEEIAAKIQTVKNGIVGEQTTGEFINKLSQPTTVNPNLIKNPDAYGKALNQQSVLDSQYTNDYEKQLYLEHQADIDNANKTAEAAKLKLERKELAVSDRAETSIAKLRAEMKSQEASIEQTRIVAKKNLTEFLAQIGALRTDGNAQTGLETLEQAYQAQKMESNNKYKFAIAEIQDNMYADINDMRSNLDDEILKINYDLTKSESEVRRDIAKVNYNFQKDSLSVIADYTDRMDKKNTAYASNLSKLAEDNQKLMFELMGGGASWAEAGSLVNNGSYKGDEKSMTRVNEILNTSNSNFISLTPTQKINGLQFLIQEKAPADLIAKFKAGDENTLLTTLRLMEDNK